MKRFYWSIIVIGLTLPSLVGADRLPGFQGRSGDSTSVPSLKPPIKFETFGELINAILDVIIDLGVPVAVLFLIYSGFLFVTARGNKEKLELAKTTFFWTIIGIAILLGAKVISSAISGTIQQLR